MTIDGQPTEFATPALLTDWLHCRGVDTSAWGQDDAKRVDDLWQEIQIGECQLRLDVTTDLPLRIVQVVEVLIEQEGKLLTEAAQCFADGRLRIRNRPPSEKLYRHETPLAAARRCILEELAVAPATITFPAQEPPSRVARDESGSYPNLTSEYTFYTVHAHVTDLPTDPFTTPNAAHSVGDPIVAHQWVWGAGLKG